MRDDVIQLTGARIALDALKTERINLRVQRGRILPFDSRTPPTREVDLSGHLLLPGLINAHDHLEFNLFPRLGKGPWASAREWAAEIHQPDCSPVREHRSVPKPVRLIWGAIRNVLSGVTTVAHHNPFDDVFLRPSFPVRVVRRFGWAHSLDFSYDVVARHRATPPGWPFIVHAAEGTDERARQELARLDEFGVLDQRTVLVHAAGATTQQLGRIRTQSSAVVWCPSSNLFTLGTTLSPEALRSLPLVALGTDSALTADGDLVDEIETAHKRCGISETEIYRFVTTNPARALRLRTGEGTIRENGVADLLAVRDEGQSPAAALANLHPELLLKSGRPVLISSRMSAARDGFSSGPMSWLNLENRGRFLVRAPLGRIYEAARKAIGSEIRLAGKLVTT